MQHKYYTHKKKYDGNRPSILSNDDGKIHRCVHGAFDFWQKCLPLHSTMDACACSHTKRRERKKNQAFIAQFDVNEMSVK